MAVIHSYVSLLGTFSPELRYVRCLLHRQTFSR
jgi:hypothetical protein